MHVSTFYYVQKQQLFPLNDNQFVLSAVNNKQLIHVIKEAKNKHDTHGVLESQNWGHSSISYAPYSFRVKIRIRSGLWLGLGIRDRIRVRVWDYG